MKHARHIPGLDDVHLAKLSRHKTCALMATDALRGLEFHALCDVVEAAIEARPDIDQARLAELARTLDQRAWRLLKPEDV